MMTENRMLSACLNQYPCFKSWGEPFFTGLCNVDNTTAGDQACSRGFLNVSSLYPSALDNGQPSYYHMTCSTMSLINNKG
jgi:hypothetical protein